jgi:hypothetical protein
MFYEFIDATKLRWLVSGHDGEIVEGYVQVFPIPMTRLPIQSRICEVQRAWVRYWSMT